MRGCQILFSVNCFYFSKKLQSICNFLPAFENDPPIVGILFPVPQIMIHQLRGIIFSISRNFLIYLSIYASVLT